MKIIRMVLVALIMFTVLSSPASLNRLDSNDRPTGILCFKTGEQISGMNKICYYNCAGSEAAITVGVAELCPLSIER